MKNALFDRAFRCGSALILMAAVSACGKYGELEPQPGSKGVPTAYGQEKPETSDVLLTPSAQARPGRNVELLRRSQRRQDDEFDLAPGTEPNKAEKSGEKSAEQPTEEPTAPGSANAAVVSPIGQAEPKD
ncbi:MAG: hypothetical protein KAZ17_01305 [Sphingorhabdus sp.]|nr:hypothetical protein [Sphingorhabdus sp.]